MPRALAVQAVLCFALTEGVVRMAEEACAVPKRGVSLLAQRFHNVPQTKAKKSTALSQVMHNVTRFSFVHDVPNVIFVAGVEGSGHHFMTSFFDELVIDRITFPLEWSCGTIWEQRGIEPMREKLTGLRKGSVYVLNGDDHYPGRPGYPGRCIDCQASYPCGAGNHKERISGRWPRMDWIAQASREAGVALHVIYMYRELADCLASDCLHSHFEECDLQAETLALAGEELASQVWKTFGTQEFGLNQGMVSCFTYGDDDIMEVEMQQAFGKEKVPDGLVTSQFHTQIPRHMRESIANWPRLVENMAQAELDLGMLCRAFNRVTLASLMEIAQRK